jgi:hypothetical protein
LSKSFANHLVGFVDFLQIFPLILSRGDELKRFIPIVLSAAQCDDDDEEMDKVAPIASVVAATTSQFETMLHLGAMAKADLLTLSVPKSKEWFEMFMRDEPDECSLRVSRATFGFLLDKLYGAGEASKVGRPCAARSLRLAVGLYPLAHKTLGLGSRLGEPFLNGSCWISPISSLSAVP